MLLASYPAKPLNHVHRYRSCCLVSSSFWLVARRREAIDSKQNCPLLLRLLFVVWRLPVDLAD